MVKDLEKAFPIASIENKCIINNDNEITIGFQLLLPESFQMTGGKLNEINENFAAFLKTVRVDSRLHLQSFVYEGYYKSGDVEGANSLVYETEKFFDGRQMLLHYANLFITISDRSVFNLTSIGSLQKAPSKAKLNKMLKEWEKIENSIINGVRGLSFMKSKRMSNQELSDAIYNYYQMSYDKPKTNAKELLDPLSWDEDTGDIKIGSEFVGISTMVSEPSFCKSWVKPKLKASSSLGKKASFKEDFDWPCSFFFPITLGLPFKHCVNTFIDVADQKAAISKMSNIERFTSFSQFFLGEFAIAKGRDAKMYKNLIAKDDLVPTVYGQNVMYSSSNKNDLKTYESLVSNAFQECGGIQTWRENASSLVHFFACIPGNAKNYPADRMFIQANDISAQLVSWETQISSDSQGYLFNDICNNIVRVDLGKGSGAKHGTVVGETGAGKSVALNEIVGQSLNQKQKIFILDIGGSFEKLCHLENGYYADLGVKEEQSFAPFQYCGEIDGKWDYDGSLSDEGGKQEGKDHFVNFLLSVVCTVRFKESRPSDEEKAVLRKSITAYFDAINEEVLNEKPSFSGWIDFTHSFEKQLKVSEREMLNWDSFRLVVEPFTVGQYSHILNGKVIKDFTEYDMVAYDLEGVAENDELFELCCLNVTQISTMNMERLPKSVVKLFILDEAIDFLKSEVGGNYFAGGYRKWRKRNGRIWLATQDVSFMDSLHDFVRNSILRNARIRLVLRGPTLRESALKDLKSALDLSEKDLEMYRSTEYDEDNPYRDALLRVGDESKIIRIAASPKNMVVYDTRAEVLEKIAKIFKETNHMGLAVNQYYQDYVVNK